MTLFLEVMPGVESVQGYCTINTGATVVCHLGYETPAEWRSGIFSAIVRPIPIDYRRVRVKIQGPATGDPVLIELMTDSSEPGTANWCFVPGDSSSSGFSVRAIDGAPLCIQTLKMSDRKIEISVGSAQKNPSDVLVDVYLRRVAKNVEKKDGTLAPRKLKRIHLRADPGACAAVIAQVGIQRPQYLTAAHKCFYF